MNRSILAGVLAAAVIATPVLAQTYQQPVVQRDTVPVQITQAQIKTLQRTLNQKGFKAGTVDGLWGDNTAAALKRFQAKNQLNPTGELDRTTELKLGMVPPSNQLATPAPAVVTVPTAAAPATTAPPAPVAVVPVNPAPSLPATPPAAAVIAPVQTPVATQPPPGPQPRATSGANSFTEGQAKDRIEGNGFTDVRDLSLDSSGIWRGLASKNGQPVHVWLDYQGDVSQQ